ncbi:transcriptional regulator [Bacillus wiedmannii]|uniref:transcriptional regulator n=1 Tax=Bacillus cereus group TaxID=86661 RepID=UPI000BF8918C|nr:MULTISPECIES: transcriptional regulator [Bacillus cereus group]KAA0768120.1 XRE family transcriptional regulator [Bacillus sp. BB51/4]PEN45645.1 transcriptional regulator [Bacillus wiedmannii]
MLDKTAIGKRIEQIKNTHIPPLSYSEFGTRLKNKDGKVISKGTVNSWVRGFGIPVHEVIEQIARIGGVTTEWIYTGKEMSKLLCEVCKEELIIESNNNLVCPICSSKFKLIKL